MATTTEDPRIQRIERSQVYGLFHGQLLFYIGETTNPLSRRLHFHESRSSKEDHPVCKFMRTVDDVDIRPLDYETEKAALDRLGEATLNVQPPKGATYDGYPWTPPEVDRKKMILENGGSLAEVSERLGIPYSQVWNAAVKLGWHDGDGNYKLLDWQEVGEIWYKYHTFDDLTYGDLADEYGVCKSTVGQIIREDTHADVDKPTPGEMRAESWYDENECVRTSPSQPILRARARG